MNNWCICWFFMHPLNAKLNPISHLLALLGGANIVVISRLRVKLNLHDYLILFYFYLYLARTTAGCSNFIVCLENEIPKTAKVKTYLLSCGVELSGINILI